MESPPPNALKKTRSPAKRSRRRTHHVSPELFLALHERQAEFTEEQLAAVAVFGRERGKVPRVYLVLSELYFAYILHLREFLVFPKTRSIKILVTLAINSQSRHLRQRLRKLPSESTLQITRKLNRGQEHMNGFHKSVQIDVLQKSQCHGRKPLRILALFSPHTWKNLERLIPSLLPLD